MDRIESRIEQRIREAQESGAFDDLPGAGKPLPGRGEPYDEDWWVKDFARREGLAGDPAALIAVVAEVADLPARVDRLAARRGLAEAELSTVEAERVVRGWRARRRA